MVDTVLFVLLLLGVLLAVLGLPTLFARAGPRARLLFIALAAAAGASIGWMDPLWGHRLTGLILFLSFFQVLAVLGAAVARDGNRVRAGLLIVVITWISYVLVSVVASGRSRA